MGNAQETGAAVAHPGRRADRLHERRRTALLRSCPGLLGARGHGFYL